jgi:sigma-B regulation protein RsbU (phosphoserine phosphatase)
VEGSDEIGLLGSSFNKMAVDLGDYMERLKVTTAAKERIESELKVAHEIQAGILPRLFPAFPDRKEFDIYALMDPAKEVGGDFYDFFIVDNDKLYFAIGDVSDKGVPAALFMMITRTLLKNEAMRGLSPEEVLFNVNNTIFPENDSCMFVTILLASLDLRTGELELSNAGHNPPLLFSGGAGFEFIKLPKGLVVGAREGSVFEKMSLRLKEKDTLFFYTDGVTEAMNPNREFFSEARLRDGLSSLRAYDAQAVIKGIREDISGFALGAIQSDDITMLTLRYLGR